MAAHLSTDAADLASWSPRRRRPTRATPDAGGLNYLFKSLDLIPDGIEDLGFLDDAFVLRVSAAIALRTSANAAEVRDASPTLVRLAGEASLVADLLGQDFARLEAHVATLTNGAARGDGADHRATTTPAQAFLQEVKGWARLRRPTFTVREEPVQAAVVPPAKRPSS